MERSPASQKGQCCCCRHHGLLQRLNTRICSTLSLPTVHAAAMYKRLTPTEELTDDNEKQSKASSVENFQEEPTSSRLDLPQDDSQESLDRSSEGDTARLSRGVRGELATRLLAERANQTPWERIKDAYTIDGSVKYCPVECFDLILTSASGFLIGALYGGFPALRLGKKRYIDVSQGAAYETRFHAISDSVSAGNRGAIRYGMRWGWRVMILATTFHGMSTIMSLYRNKADILNYGTAAFTTGALYRFNMGLTGMIGGGVAGLVIGIPAACSLLLFQKLTGVNSLERSVQHRADFMQGYYNDRDNFQQDSSDAIEVMDKVMKELDRKREQ